MGQFIDLLIFGIPTVAIWRPFLLSPSVGTFENHIQKSPCCADFWREKGTRTVHRRQLIYGRLIISDQMPIKFVECPVQGLHRIGLLNSN